MNDSCNCVYTEFKNWSSKMVSEYLIPISTSVKKKNEKCTVIRFSTSEKQRLNLQIHTNTLASTLIKKNQFNPIYKRLKTKMPPLHPIITRYCQNRMGSRQTNLTKIMPISKSLQIRPRMSHL